MRFICCAALPFFLQPVQAERHGEDELPIGERIEMKCRGDRKGAELGLKG